MILQTKNLTKKFEERFAVSNLNINIRKGQIYGLLGKNGAGKTTTLKMITGLTKPTQGKICLFGQRCNTPTKEIFCKIGVLIETPAFYENLTAWENLKIIAELRGVHSKNSINEVMTLLDIKNEKEKKVKQFSLGMKQRLGIAMALMHEPELIILDEPTNGLDPEGIKQMRNLIKKLSQQKKVTFLISSHILNEMEQLVDVVGIIDNGVLIEELKMSEIKKRNRHYVKMKLSNMERAIPILERKLNIFDFEIVNDREIKIFQIDINYENVNRVLNNEGIGVSEISLNKGNLEEYFLNVIGDGKNV